MTDYDGLDYSRSNPPPDPALKWDTDLGIATMLPVWEVAIPEIRHAINQVTNVREYNQIARWLEGFEHYIHLQPGARGAKSFVDWVQKAIPHQVPIFSMTFGQMFEEAISRRGLHPFNSTKMQTFWTGTWMAPVESLKPEQPYEGYGIVTRPHGWSVIYQEDRAKGLSAGMFHGRIKHGRFADKKLGIVTRVVNSHKWVDENVLSVYPQTMDVLHGPGSTQYAHRLQEYVYLHSPGNYNLLLGEAYDLAISRVLDMAEAVAGFMNDRDFHALEELKRQIRRSEHARPVIETELSSHREKQVPPALRDLIGDAAVLSEQLHLGKRAYDLFKVFYTGRWDGEGWRDVTSNLPETDRPDQINIYNALRLGSYPVEEWQGMPKVEEDVG